jgi:hypothetical protein
MLRSALLTSGATRVMRASGAFYIAFATRMSRTWSAHHVYNICVGCTRDAAPAACDTHGGMSTSNAFAARVSSFMYCRCRALLARRKCAGPWVTFGQYCTYHPCCIVRPFIGFEGLLFCMHPQADWLILVRAQMLRAKFAYDVRHVARVLSIMQMLRAPRDVTFGPLCMFYSSWIFFWLYIVQYFVFILSALHLGLMKDIIMEDGWKQYKMEARHCTPCHRR